MEENALIGNPDAFDLKEGHKYNGYRQYNSYEYDPGVFVLPLASREPKNVVVRVHGGIGIRKVNVAAMKKGNPPILPAAVDTDRDTLVACSVQVPLPAFIPDQADYNWMASGTYLYVTTKGGPRIPGRDFLPLGQYPFPLPLQDAAVESLAQAGIDMQTFATVLESQIPAGTVTWPFTTYPPQFFNSILLRDEDKEFTAELTGGGFLP